MYVKVFSSILYILWAFVFVMKRDDDEEDDVDDDFV